MTGLLDRIRRWWAHGHMAAPRIPPLPDHWTAPDQTDNRTYVKDTTR